jgi:hypothetical protein
LAPKGLRSEGKVFINAKLGEIFTVDLEHFG